MKVGRVDAKDLHAILIDAVSAGKYGRFARDDFHELLEVFGSKHRFHFVNIVAVVILNFPQSPGRGRNLLDCTAIGQYRRFLLQFGDSLVAQPNLLVQDGNIFPVVALDFGNGAAPRQGPSHRPMPIVLNECVELDAGAPNIAIAAAQFTPAVNDQPVE